MNEYLQSIIDRDPAAKSKLSVILTYPGVKAVFFHQIAHFFCVAKFDLVARIISQYSRFLTGIEIHPKAKIGNIEITFYKVMIEKEKLTLSIPLNQQSHLRPVSSISQINKATSILKSKPRIKRTMWSRRAQEYDQKINSGKLYELAEVVRDLNKKTDIIAEQSYSERQLFEKAYNRLKSELEIVLGEKAQQKMDKALKKSNENLIQKETLV